jgi:hypothetical protein
MSSVPRPAARTQDCDNDATANVGSTLRYGWIDVTRKQCASAAQVHAALTRGGYAGPLKPCSQTCTALAPGGEQPGAANTRVASGQALNGRPRAGVPAGRRRCS